MLEIALLGSGSSGNATLIRTERSAILVDAGFTCRQINLRLAELGWTPDKLDGVVISHEHTDHVCGLRVLNKKHPQTVYGTERLHATRELQEANLHRKETIVPGHSFSIAEFEITPFTIPHDAVDPVGFIIEVDGLRIGHVTDIGYPTELARQHLKGCNILVLESNHDRKMLIEGPYPWPVKQRIMSRTGHLNNEDTGDLLHSVAHSDLHTVLLAHLSQQNNSTSLAKEIANNAINSNGNKNETKIIVTSQATPSERVRL